MWQPGLFAQELILARVGIGLKAGCDYTAPFVNPYKINKILDVSRLMMSALADIDEYAAVMDMFCEWWARKLPQRLQCQCLKQTPVLPQCQHTSRSPWRSRRLCCGR